MLITNSTPDELYFNQLLSFLSSVMVNSPGTDVRVFLANYPKDKEEKLVSFFTEFVFENRPIDMIDDRGFALILFRVALIKECFEKYKESVAWVDTDVIVRSTLDDFLLVDPTHLKILKRKTKTDAGAPINAGVLNIGYSEATYKFVCDWQEGCLSTPEWGQGQARLWDAYLKNKKVELVDIGDRYNDLGGHDRPDAFADDSVMWHCKKNHFINEKYQAEFNYYFDKVKGYFYG